ncbi:MAG: cation:proton antiporter subunit C [Methanomicrobiales archaeon]|nr:cation:proton antiporter subunit C [Methanomicrobiales archaeon]
MLYDLPFLAAALLMVIGIATMLLRRNLIKVVMGLSLVEAGVNLLLVALGYRGGGIAPIFTNAPQDLMVLPTVQAMTLTNIVIGIATTALMLSFVMVIYRRYGTADADAVRRLRG